jgi:DNA-binding MarR family transcriptional regulator
MHKEHSSRERVFIFLIKYKHEHDGNAPTLKEIGEACCLSTSTVYYHLLTLELQNRIQRTGERSRNIEIVGGGWNFGE